MKSVHVCTCVCIYTYVCVYIYVYTCTHKLKHAEPQILCSQVLPPLSLLPFVLLGWFARPQCEWPQYPPTTALAEVRGPVWVQGEAGTPEVAKDPCQTIASTFPVKSKQQQEGARYLSLLWRE